MFERGRGAAALTGAKSKPFHHEHRPTTSPASLWARLRQADLDAQHRLAGEVSREGKLAADNARVGCGVEFVRRAVCRLRPCRVGGKA